MDGTSGDARAYVRSPLPATPLQRKGAHPNIGVRHIENSSALAAEILGVALGKVLPFFRQIVQCENRRHRTHRYAGAAVDALDWINVQHLFFGVTGCILLGMNAIHRTSIDASGVFGPDAWFCNYVCHWFSVSLMCAELNRTAHSNKNACFGTAILSRQSS